MYKPMGFTLSGSQIEKLKKSKESGVPTTLELSTNQMGGEHDLYLTQSQIKKLGKATGGVRITFSKTQMKAQKGGFLGALLALAKTFLPKVLPSLGALGLSAASGVISGATHKASGGGLKRAGGGVIPLYHSKQDIQRIIGTMTKLEGGGIVQSGSCARYMKAIREQKGGFIGTLLATLANILLPALLGGKGLKRAGQKWLDRKAPLTNFDFMDYYKGGTPQAFGGVFSRDSLPKLKNRYYNVNLDDQQGSGTHWVVVYNVGDTCTCIHFDSFAVDPPEEVLNRMRQTGKKMIMNVYRIQDIKSINCGFFCIYMCDELLKGWEFIDVLTDFNPKNYKKNDDLINLV